MEIGVRKTGLGVMGVRKLTPKIKSKTPVKMGCLVGFLHLLHPFYHVREKFSKTNITTHTFKYYLHDAENRCNGCK